MRKKGKFFVIEGTDGSGKTAQFRKLVERLKKDGRDVATFDFPQYDKESSYFVREYLNGRYGTVKEVGPYKASLFYALDRFDVAPQLKEWREKRMVIVSNRYVASNMGHQGAKIKSGKKRSEFFVWLHDLEHKVLGIPRPDLTVILHVPAKISQKLVDKKGKRKYIGGAKRDIHEADLSHLKQAESAYIEMAKAFPGEVRLIECVKNGKLLSIEDIHELLWGVVCEYLKK
ncbi:MAG: thymidylate kinase [Patescibacteria group bacterium]